MQSILKKSIYSSGYACDIIGGHSVMIFEEEEEDEEEDTDKEWIKEDYEKEDEEKEDIEKEDY